MTKVVDMLDTVRRITVRTISGDLHTFTFTVLKNYHCKEKLPMSKSICASFGTKQCVLLMTLISF